LVDGRPDEDRFWKATTSLVMRAASAARGNRPRVAACGECSPWLVRAGNLAAAIRLEQLWDEVVKTFDVEVFCGYLFGADGFDEHSQTFRELCAVHSTVHSP
jgi:hypothetical protein